MRKFIREMFQDDVHEICVGRVSLVLGLILTVITATIDMDVLGDMTWAEAALRASPSIVGLIAYVFTRLFEQREFIAEVSDKIINKKK